MRWFEQFLSEDEIVVRDKFNRRRLISQRKWVVSFCAIALLFKADQVSLLDTFGPLDLSLLTDDHVSITMFAATSFVFFYCLLQVPAFVSNYDEYIRETFSRLRVADLRDEADTISNLGRERQQIDADMLLAEERDNELQKLRHEYFELSAGSKAAIEQIAGRERLATKLGIDASDDLNSALKKAELELRARKESLYNSKLSAESQLNEAIAKLQETTSSREQKLSLFWKTELLTDLTRIIPTAIFGLIAVYCSARAAVGWVLSVIN
ncbi:hypothetical protein [Henriciella pelagia]|jgi:hypothetical protein|uniref:Uncharacterized protein n=1 Tax=Henriciella pelagia TaxID=1977912 RepID=A0ABQ1JX67_9PROT|nr:hypothetical protein [Henriciella pelagia]GGB77350.1 hypothetical protein GCM10011503_27660 [Henriciella pelagia]